MVTKEMSKHLPTVHQCPEMLQLKEFVQYDDQTRFAHMAEGNLRLDVTHSNLVQRWHDILFTTESTIMQVKEKLYRHGGTGCNFMELYLRRGGSDTVFLMDEYKTLGYYGAKSGMEIHIKDLDPHSISLHGGLEDVSQVEKYEMADEEYDKMKGTVRDINRKREEAKRAEEAARGAAGEEGQDLGAPGAEEARYQLTVQELTAAYPLGARCEVVPGGRRGEVLYTGHLIAAKGWWVGVKLDEPMGANDGTKDGKRYFDCGPKYGCFSRPENVNVGNYPERDPFASDDEF